MSALRSQALEIVANAPAGVTSGILGRALNTGRRAAARVASALVADGAITKITLPGHTRTQVFVPFNEAAMAAAIARHEGIYP